MAAIACEYRSGGGQPGRAIKKDGPREARNTLGVRRPYS